MSGVAALHHISSDGTLTTSFSDQLPGEQVALDGVRYTEFDRRPGLSFGMYWLDEGVTDLQSPTPKTKSTWSSPAGRRWRSRVSLTRSKRGVSFRFSATSSTSPSRSQRTLRSQWSSVLRKVS